MRVVVFVGVFILLYQQTRGKPLNRKAKSQLTELIREKRGEVGEDEKSNEMQKFMLDLSAKEDMGRLRERFKSGASQDVENDKDYRRLKRISIHDADGDVAETSVTSGIETMNKRSLRTSKDINDETIGSFGESSLPTDEITSKRSEDSSQTYGDRLEYSDDGIESLRTSSKRAEDIHEETSEDKSKPSEDKSTAKFEHTTDNLEDGNDHDKNVDLHDEDLITNIDDSEMEGPRINSHHIVGGSWELSHNYPTAFRSSLSSENTTIPNNTTMHSEYLGDELVDDVMQYDPDDVTQYDRTKKSRRKPRVSLPRPTRSVETDYEVREISELDNQMLQSSPEDDEHVVMVKTRAIKRDGYIGCFIDQHPNRDLTKLFTVNNLTPDSCRSVCNEKGHVYAGVQYGYLCHCGDDYGKYGEAGEHECNSPCRGDEGKKCGGFWRNSVYTSEVANDDEAHGNQEENSSERETRSHIDRIIPLPESEQEEEPVRQEIKVYLRTEIPKIHENPTLANLPSSKEIKQDDRQTDHGKTVKRTKIPTPNVKHVTSPTKVVKQSSNVVSGKKKTDVNNHAYLHPQTGPTVFVPSNVVLRTITSSPEKKKYTGFIKLKQNWDDGLRKKTNPETLILAGNIESAFAEMFAKDPQFEKAEVLSLRETEIRDNPDTVHKVLVEFALIFEKEGLEKDKTLRTMVENRSRLGDMPVFVDSLDIKEYKDEENDSNEQEATAKNKRQDGVDAFLQEVFRKI